MTANIAELLKLLVSCFTEYIKFRKNYKGQWEKLFAGQDYNGLVFLTKFVEHDNWNTITEDFLRDTKFSDDKYLQLVKAYTKTGELKLFEIKDSGRRKAVRINTLIYSEFQRNASKYRLVERVYSTSGKTKAFKEKRREKTKGQTKSSL